MCRGVRSDELLGRDSPQRGCNKASHCWVIGGSGHRDNSAKTRE